MPATPEAPESRPYPETWEQVAELRVFRATSKEWASLIQWRREMRRKGWKLLRVNTESGSVNAVFGRTRADLLQRTGPES